jgi:hypothetical protein
MHSLEYIRVCRSLERLQKNLESQLETLHKDTQTTIHRCAEMQREIDAIRRQLGR